MLLLVGCIVLCELVGIIGGFATVPSIKKWYRKLKKPSWNPPAFVFGPVWTLLYLLMGVSLFFVINKPHNTTALFFFFLQLLLNFFWTFIFFSFHKIGWAFVEIMFLWMSILMTILIFYPINHIAAFLLIPYLLWASFASLLNAAIWKLNK